MSKLPRFTSLSQLKPAKLAREEVDIPEWGVSFLVWELTAEEVASWQAKNLIMKNGRVVGANLASSRARLLAKAIKDDLGNPLFDENSIKELMRRGNAAVAKLDEVARRLSGIDADEDEDEDPLVPNESSSTDSLSPSA